MKKNVVMSKWTTGQVAKLFNVSAQTVINWLMQNRMQFDRIGKGPRIIQASELRRYVHEINISEQALDPDMLERLKVTKD